MLMLRLRRLRLGSCSCRVLLLLLRVRIGRRRGRRRRGLHLLEGREERAIGERARASNCVSVDAFLLTKKNKFSQFSRSLASGSSSLQEEERALSSRSVRFGALAGPFPLSERCGKGRIWNEGAPSLTEKERREKRVIQTFAATRPLSSFSLSSFNDTRVEQPASLIAGGDRATRGASSSRDSP